MRAIIVDDEKHCGEVLALLIARYCPQVNVQAICSNGIAALEAIGKYQPELLFLDVEMPGMSGMELLECCQALPLPFSVIFTTAYDQYALQAIRHRALDYLLKPVDKDELIAAVNKAINQPPVAGNKVPSLLQLLQSQVEVGGRISLPTANGWRMLQTGDIVYCMSAGAMTHVYVHAEQQPLIISRSLKDIEASLGNRGFLRVHNSYLINEARMEKYIKGDGGEIIMSNGERIPLARNRKAAFLKHTAEFGFRHTE
ncbi:LytTR family DNA-binding domain-containing protein [Chitinophaga pendula]|uniref:LytR/AlgR family response regulator transcription factor n=1 Tax=Chitinophaga TaxID=79328 RepID=UPI000BAFC17C|nr:MULTISPECIES: LytTR family DNA-binding domain-containing protein [Chitinophaga]ASZ10292.1 DNA-binding response regulator [Chitinophaga sp. MD30]UCJ06746.1 LytTR family DNA-binding domain-containing protein [Chitinophaga pendula]